MRAIPKTAKIHPAAKKCCGWEKPAICYLPEDFLPPPEYTITNDELLGSRILCTAVLTLTMFSSWWSDPAPQQLGCNKLVWDRFITAMLGN